MVAVARKWAFLGALPLLAALGVVSGSHLYRCPADGVTRTACCCAEHASPEAPAPAVSSPCCCDVTRVEGAAVPAEPARHATATEAPALALSIAPVLPPGDREQARHAAAAFTMRPPPIPILLRKQSFLI